MGSLERLRLRQKYRLRGKCVRTIGSERTRHNNLSLRSSSYPTSTDTLEGQTGSPAPVHQNLNVGAIAGGTIGGIAILALAILGAIMLRKRHLKRKEEEYIREQLEVKATPFNSNESRAELLNMPSFTELPPAPADRLAVFRSPSMRKERSPPRREVLLPSVTAPTASSFEPPSQLNSDVDMAAVPELLARLNSIIRRLPEGSGEAPPQYDGHR